MVVPPRLSPCPPNSSSPVPYIELMAIPMLSVSSKVVLLQRPTCQRSDNRPSPLRSLPLPRPQSSTTFSCKFTPTQATCVYQQGSLVPIEVLSERFYQIFGQDFDVTSSPIPRLVSLRNSGSSPPLPQDLFSCSVMPHVRQLDHLIHIRPAPVPLIPLTYSIGPGMRTQAFSWSPVRLPSPFGQCNHDQLADS